MSDVLIVDDDATLCLVLDGLLSVEGYTVVAVADGRRALAVPREQPTRLVILDVSLSALGAKELREAMLANDALATVPVVIYSATSFGDPRRQMRSVWRQIKKGAQVEELLAVVRLTLEGGAG